MNLFYVLSLSLIFSQVASAQSSESSSRIDFLLSKKNPSMYGPNCWNSVLYVKGFSPGVFYSDGEMTFWLSSPLCKRVEDYNEGDIVDIAAMSENGKNYNSLHSYVYISPTQGFTKNGPDIDEPYQLTSHNKINSYYDLSDIECLNVSYSRGLELGCQIISSAYRCSELQTFIPMLENSLYYKRIKTIAHELTKHVFSNGEMSKAYSEELKGIRIVAEEELHIPTFNSLPSSLQLALRDYFEIAIGSEYDSQSFKDYITEIVYLNAYKDQQIVIQDSPSANLIKKFRADAKYPNMNIRDFYSWAHVLNTTRNMQKQITELKP